MEIIYSSNVFLQTENYFFDAIVFDSKVLIVTFEAAGDPIARPDPFRPGWGANFLRGRRVSHLCIKPRMVDWYRQPDLVAALETLKDSGFFRRFDRVVTYGGSMGGFAALVYADLIGANTVVSINPQSTLNPDVVPEENRFNAFLKYRWDGPYSDAAGHAVHASKVYVIFDPHWTLDRMHADRLTGQNFEKIVFPFVGHHIPAHLSQIGALKDLFDGAIDNVIKPAEFAKKFRQRRTLKRYFNVMQEMPRVQKSDRFKNIVDRYKAVSPLLGMD